MFNSVQSAPPSPPILFPCHGGESAVKFCSVCGNEGRIVRTASKIAVVDYYRCPQCGKVWTAPKADDPRACRSVTPSTDSKNSRTWRPSVSAVSAVPFASRCVYWPSC